MRSITGSRRPGRPDPELVVLLQATSPVRRPEEIDAAIARLHDEQADSLFSACREAVHVWHAGPEGLDSITYDWESRAREQDMPVLYRENGSIYVFKTQVLRQNGNRLGGRITVFEMDWWSSFQLDEPEHVQLLDWILSGRP